MTAGDEFRRDFEAEYELPDAGSRRLLSEICELLDEIERMKGQVRTEGDVLEGSRGQPVPHPLIAVVDAKRATYVKLLARLEPLDTAGKRAEEGGRRLAQGRWAA